MKGESIIMKKIYQLILSLLLALSCTTGLCTHVHDENCGYDPQTETGCLHECNIGLEIQPYFKFDPEE